MKHTLKTGGKRMTALLLILITVDISVLRHGSGCSG